MNTVPLPPAELMAEFTRGLVDGYTAWDSRPVLMSVHWDGGMLFAGTAVVVSPGTHPDLYPAAIADMAAAETAEQFCAPRRTLAGYLFQVEGYSVPDPGPGGGCGERDQFDTHCRERTLYTLPGAAEVAMAWCADVHGRAWVATCRRGTPGVAEVSSYPAGPAYGFSGRCGRRLRTAALVAGQFLYGLDPPGGGTGRGVG